MGYNPSAKDRNEFWSRSAMMAQSCKLRGKHPRLIQAVVDIMSKRHPWFRYSHAYGEPGGAWGLIALGHLDARTYRKVMQAYRWWFALSWEPGYGLRYTTPHEGSPLGQDELFNNVYALVLRADRATLQITGAKEVRWIKRLRRTALATPVSIRRGKDGRVTLEPAIPGSPVRFTLDGKEPSASSWLYKKPFALPRGGKVTARSYSLAGKPGKTSARLFGPAKTRWRVIDASGDRDPKMALKRAELAIDDNPALPWRVDVGFESATFPHHLAIDLGGKQLMAGLALHFVQKKKAIKQYELQSSKDGKRWVTVAKGTFESYKERCEIRLRRVLATRYIKLIALSGTGLPTAEGGGLAIYELDLLLPAR